MSFILLPRDDMLCELDTQLESICPFRAGERDWVKRRVYEIACMDYLTWPRRIWRVEALLDNVRRPLKTYIPLTVPEHKGDAAETLGARWDSSERTWFAPDQLVAARCKEWIAPARPKPKPEPKPKRKPPPEREKNLRVRMKTERREKKDEAARARVERAFPHMFGKKKP